MAKPNRNTNTRLATTVNARYFVSSGASDTFYLDGRLSGKRERRAADVTLDREQRGFFLSVFAHTGSQPTDEVQAARLRKSLDRILHDVKNNGRNIDAEINELAECAVDISGRMTLQNDGVRQPYFAGIIVKDAEIAAITMGGGCAWLYRGDVLYPLTSDDCQLEAIDLNGKDVPGHDVYCAGVAGTVRYSNIAQLQEDDCVITCNKEVFEALGQRELLRLLYEAEDQADAAGLIITAAAAKMPGVPLQFMIGFVESITAVDKPVKAGFGRPFASMGAAALPKVSPPNKSEPAPMQEVQKELPEKYDDIDTSYGAIPPVGYDDMTASNPPYEPIDGIDDGYGPVDDDGYDIHEDEFYEDYDNSGRTRRIAFYLILAAICIGCLFAIYHMLFGRDDDSAITTTTPAITTTTTSETTTTTSETTTETTTENTDETTTETTTEGTTETTVETTTEGTTETTTSETTGTPSGDLIGTHTVSAGETLFGIAVDYYGSGSQENIDLIKNANGLTSDTVQVGDNLKIPVKN